MAIQAIIKESYTAHRKVVFNGNGYSDEWLKEAARRGLPNIRSTVEALPVLIQADTIELFERHKILTRVESESRYHIYLEKYSKQINIEAGVMVYMAKRMIFPSVGAFAASLARDASSLAAIGLKSQAIEKRAKKLADLAGEIYDDTDRLEKILVEAQEIQDALIQARAYHEKVVPLMGVLRSKVDASEKLVAKNAWPLPTYEELLFKL